MKTKTLTVIGIVRRWLPRTTLLLWASVIAVSSARAQPALDPAVEAKIQNVVNNIAPAVVIKGQGGSHVTLASRMAALHVPGVSVAVIHDGKIEWARGFGVSKIGGPPVTVNTMFQAGSISKPVTALAVLHLVQSGQLNLDANVNQYLKTWKVPENGFTAEKKVTLRELLTHTAGVTVHGFPGYASGEQVPTLVEVLNGEKPANTPAIRVDAVPNTIWRYSGGGYVITQQLLLDVTKEPFPTFMHDTVLGPLRMTHSTYEQPLPTEWRSGAATPYDVNGVPIGGGFHIYPEMAPAGLWTTPSDLARYAIEIQKSLAGQPNSILSKAMAGDMVKLGGLGSWGLGLQVGGNPDHPNFGHGGADEGFISQLIVYDKGDGVAVMTNGDNGGRMATEIIRTIAFDYHWPDFAPLERAVVPLSDADFDKFAGYYRRTNTPPEVTIYFHIYRDANHFYSQITGQKPVEIFPESPSEFFTTIVEAEISFDISPRSEVDGLVLHQNNRQIPWQRVPTAVAETAIGKVQQRIKDNVPSAGTEAALRHQIETLERDEPDYNAMGPGLTEATRQQLPQIKDLFKTMGALKALRFSKVLPNGNDLYLATFEHGEMDCSITPLSPTGKVDGDFFHPLP